MSWKTVRCAILSVDHGCLRDCLFSVRPVLLFLTHYAAHCANHAHSLAVVDRVFGFRLDALKHDYHLVHEPFPSQREVLHDVALV